MTRLQILVISLSALSTFALYFGFDTKSSKEKVEIENLERTGIEIDTEPLIESAKQELSGFDLNEVVMLENQANAADGEAKIDALKKLSGKWYRLDKPFIAGSIASEIAEQTGSAESWSIAATTFLAGISDSDQMVREGSLRKAIEALENAISIDPENEQHRVNLALVYAERPPQGDPMKGVQMLLSLNQKNPESVLVLNALGRLAIKTGQWERATERLEKANSVDPDNTTTICLLSEVYQQVNDRRAQEMKDKCESLTLK